MTDCILRSEFELPGQTGFYKGKVREVFTIKNDLLVMVATDRISAFDVVLPKGIPYKGQVLNQIAAQMLDAAADVVPNWKLAVPDPNVTVGYRCEPFKVEMVIRGYLAGHAWRVYRDGTRSLCGVSLPDGLKENDPLPHPIITPTTKVDHGHDEDISKDAILAQGLVSNDDYEQLEAYTHALFQRGSEIAQSRGLILVDTKYEFGTTPEGEIVVIDEIHTPDSSRYFYADGYEQRQQCGEPQRQLSKEFVRQWLIQNGFQGKEGEKVPTMSSKFVEGVSERYIELYQHITDSEFEKASYTNVQERMLTNISKFLSRF